MAIDSASKRASVLGVALVSSLAVIPDSTIAQADRQTVAHCYSGILADAPIVDTPDCVLPLESNIGRTETNLTGLVNDTAIAVSGAISVFTALQSPISDKDINLSSEIDTENNLTSAIQPTLGINAELCDC